MQPRATINLAKASRLIDDKTSLVADPTSDNPSSKARRKSAFAEEDDGYQFVEEGFRIRFANGETIDFYADDRAQKEGWMTALSQGLGKQTSAKTAKWTDLVLAKGTTDSKAIKAANPDIVVQAPSRQSSGLSTYSKSAPTSPVKSTTGSVVRKELPPQIESDVGPAVPVKEVADQIIRPGTPPLSPRAGHRERKAVKSMIF